jgi:hypothetical protein
MLVQLHGQESRPSAASEQSARDGCSVSQPETSVRAHAAFTDMKRPVNRPGVVSACHRPKHWWHVERYSHRRSQRAETLTDMFPLRHAAFSVALAGCPLILSAAAFGDSEIVGTRARAVSRVGAAPQPSGALREPQAVLFDPFLADVEERTFRFFWETANPKNGLVPDRYPIPSFASVAAVGFALTAYPIGVERGYITRAPLPRSARYPSRRRSSCLRHSGCTSASERRSIHPTGSSMRSTRASRYQRSSREV